MTRQCGHIRVPDYQRAYSWDTDPKGCNKQVNMFLADLEDYLRSGNKKTPYYFGHFLFEELGEGEFAVIDGQQRLTTIIIFVSAALERIKSQRELNEAELILGEDLIKRRSNYRFSTVDYDNQLFRDYVIDRVKKDHNGVETTSGHRIMAAYDFFASTLSTMDIEHVEQLIWAAVNASCTTHVVTSEAEAVQMFLFQNNRGKHPSRLEVIKAQFMYAIHVYGGEGTEAMLQEVTSRFETIYRSISRIENFVDEDDVLSHTMRVYCNSLWGDSPENRVRDELSKTSRLEFIREFTLSLECSFNNLVTLNDDRCKDVDIEAALVCGHYDIALPFFIKAYSNGVSWEDLKLMARALGDILLRDNIIGTRAYLTSRLNGVFQSFTSRDVNEIVKHINWMKHANDWYWAYWNNDELERVAYGYWGPSSHKAAKVLLWRYENSLIDNGYPALPFCSIEAPHLEHIAPQTENESPAAGYDVYDEDFKEKYLCCIGNFLLLSGTHNIVIGNKPFEEKRATYGYLAQGREIQEMTESDHVWNREKIAQRLEKLIKFMLDNI